MTEAELLITHIQQDMRQAMKDGNRTIVSGLRSLLARISNAEAVTSEATGYNHSAGVGSTEAARKELTTTDIAAIIQDELDEINVTLHAIDASSEHATELRKKAEAIQKYI